VIKWLAIASGVLALAVGGAMMNIAWQENPQCEFHCETLGVSWWPWLLVGISWAAPVFVVCFVVLGVLAKVGYAFWPPDSTKPNR
jgi:hypothetical protein